MYSDIGLFQTAEHLSEEINKVSSQGLKRVKHPIEDDYPEYNGNVDLYMNRFLGREDLFKQATDSPSPGNSIMYVDVMQPLSELIIREHLEGKKSIATFVQRSNNTAHFLVLDIDVSKKMIMETDGKGQAFENYYDKAGEIAIEIITILRKIGLHGYLEETGGRGYHVWLLFEEWIAIRYINMLSDMISSLVSIPEEITVEMFPNKSHLKPGRIGQAIKLPYGVHPVTGRNSRFLYDDMTVVHDIENYLHDMVLFSLIEIKRVVSTRTNLKLKQKRRPSIQLTEDECKLLHINVKTVLERCSLMLYLYNKAKQTSYLTHGERLSVLYVFGHLGDEGKEFVHTVMEYTINYQYHVTQRFIDKMPAKPVSCSKLQDQYKQVTAEYGCDCKFRRIPDCYPSPVLHVIREENKVADVTVPSLRKTTEDVEEKALKEINIPMRVAGLTEKLQELKKQKRGIEKSINKIDKELQIIFDSEGVDCMEIDIGILCRNKTDQGTDWYVEL